MGGGEGREGGGRSCRGAGASGGTPAWRPGTRGEGGGTGTPGTSSLEQNILVRWGVKGGGLGGDEAW